jgi:hypothetical protein
MICIQRNNMRYPGHEILVDVGSIIWARVRTHSNPERDDGSEDDGGQEVDGELVVARGHAPKVLEAAERRFDPPAIAIAPLIVADGAFA